MADEAEANSNVSSLCKTVLARLFWREIFVLVRVIDPGIFGSNGLME